MENNKNKKTSYQILKDTVKAVVRGKFITVRTTVKQETSPVKYLILAIKKLKNEE